MALAKVPNNKPSPLVDNLEQLPVVAASSASKNKYKSKICTDFDENSEYADLAEKIFQNVNAAFDRDELM